MKTHRLTEENCAQRKEKTMRTQRHNKSWGNINGAAWQSKGICWAKVSRLWILLHDKKIKCAVNKFVLNLACLFEPAPLRAGRGLDLEKKSPTHLPFSLIYFPQSASWGRGVVFGLHHGWLSGGGFFNFLQFDLDLKNVCCNIPAPGNKQINFSVAVDFTGSNGW